MSVISICDFCHVVFICLIPGTNFCVSDGYEKPKLILTSLSKKGFY